MLLLQSTCWGHLLFSQHPCSKQNMRELQGALMHPVVTTQANEAVRQDSRMLHHHEALACMGFWCHLTSWTPAQEAQPESGFLTVCIHLLFGPWKKAAGHHMRNSCHFLILGIKEVSPGEQHADRCCRFWTTSTRHGYRLYLSFYPSFNYIHLWIILPSCTWL